MTEIKYYRENKKSAVIRKAEYEVKTIAQGLVEELEEKGHKLEHPQMKPLRKGINELRVITSRGHFRILYFLFDGNSAVLVHAFSKKTRAVPQREIDLAIKRMKKYKLNPDKHTYKE